MDVDDEACSVIEASEFPATTADSSEMLGSVHAEPTMDSGLAACTDAIPVPRKRPAEEVLASRPPPRERETASAAEAAVVSAVVDSAIPAAKVTLAETVTVPVSSLFHGLLRYGTKCLHCENVSTRTESFSELSLAVEDKPLGRSLSACLNSFTSSIDKLTGSNK